MTNKKIPVVFAFDENYKVPASVAISSLIRAKKADTNYEVIVFHDGLSPDTISKMEKICPIHWVKIDSKVLDNAPVNSYWPIAVYYRLLIADLLPQYDKVIWSDVDVMFKGDLSDIYNQDLSDYDWAGVIAEKQDEKNGVHQHFPENKNPFIHMSGFMVVNAKKWRAENKLQKFIEIIKEYNLRLKMFDLEVLNLSCDKIKAVPFEYCVLENIYNAKDITTAPEYPWLFNVYGHQGLEKAKENPVIIHYAGCSPKIWNRKKSKIDPEYFYYLEHSVFYDKDFYAPGIGRYTKIFFMWLYIKLCPVKKWRAKMRAKKRKMIYW